MVALTANMVTSWLSTASFSPKESWNISGKGQMLHLCFDQLRSIVQTVCLSSSWVSWGLPVMSRESNQVQSESTLN